MIKKLRRKFILIAIGSMLAVLVLIMGTVNIVSYRRVVDNADSMTKMLSDNNGSFTTVVKQEEPVDEPTNSHKDPEMKEFSPETPYQTRFFSVKMDADGTIEAVNMESIAAISEEIAAEYAKEAAENQNEKGFVDIYRYRVTDNGDSKLLMFVDCRDELNTFHNFLLVSILMSAVGLLGVFILVVIFSRYVFRPVIESYEKQKQFITDASHEIKTPLTIIDANTEVLEMEQGENAWTVSTKKQIKRLTSLTKQMISLSRMDEEGDLIEKEQFCLSDSVAESTAAFEGPATTSGKVLTCQIEEGIYYLGNERKIRQLVSLLVDNAVKYSAGVGNIVVSLNRKGKKIQMKVVNDASELPIGSLDMLFERFYRMDASRNSATGGSGIGLSAAKAIAQAHKGKIEAHSYDGQSLTITVSL